MPSLSLSFYAVVGTETRAVTSSVRGSGVNTPGQEGWLPLTTIPLLSRLTGKTIVIVSASPLTFAIPSP